jgi:hypothetical protein
MKAISRSQRNDGYGADFGRSRGGSLKGRYPPLCRIHCRAAKRQTSTPIHAPSQPDDRLAVRLPSSPQQRWTVRLRLGQPEQISATAIALEGTDDAAPKAAEPCATTRSSEVGPLARGLAAAAGDGDDIADDRPAVGNRAVAVDRVASAALHAARAAASAGVGQRRNRPGVRYARAAVKAGLAVTGRSRVSHPTRA